MTIQIPGSVQHPPPVNGFNQVPLHGVAEKEESESVVVALPLANNLSIEGDITFPSGATSDTRLVPALRPFSSAALHVVGYSFAEAVVTTLQKARIIRFR